MVFLVKSHRVCVIANNEVPSKIPCGNEAVSLGLFRSRRLLCCARDDRHIMIGRMIGRVSLNIVSHLLVILQSVRIDLAWIHCGNDSLYRLVAVARPVGECRGYMTPETLLVDLPPIRYSIGSDIRMTPA